MAEENKQQEPQANTGKTESVSAFRNAREIMAKERRAEEEKERARQAAEEEAAYQAREEYAKELRDDKVDLIRLKQGVIDESAEVFQNKEEKKQYTVWQKISNWLYHSAWWLGIAVFIVLLGGFLVYDYFSRVDPDLRVLVISRNNDLYLATEAMNDWLAGMTEDWNGDEKQVVECIVIPVSKAYMEESGANAVSFNTQLMVQFQTATCSLVLTDDGAEPLLEPDVMFEDLSALYPDCPFVEGYKLLLEGTNFGEAFDFTGELNAGSYLTLRIPVENMDSLADNEESYRRAKALLDKIVENLQSKEAEK